MNSPYFREGDWTLRERTGWADNRSCENLVSWVWKKGGGRYLIVVNLSDSEAQALIKVADDELRGKQ